MECFDILNTCVLSLVGSLGAIVAGFVAYNKADKIEKKYTKKK